MTESMNPPGEPPAAARPAPSWELFERSLAQTLAVLKDEFLILSARTGNRFVQFHVSPERGVQAEAVGNDHLAAAEKLSDDQVASLLALGWSGPPPAPKGLPAPGSAQNFSRRFPTPYSCEEVAHLAVQTLAAVHGIPGPEALEYKAFDEPGTPVYLPALRIEPVGQETADGGPAADRKPSRRKANPLARLRRQVLKAARELSGQGSLEFDESGWITMSMGGRTGFVRVSDNPWFMRVHLHLRSGVAADEELLARMHEVNAKMALARVIFTDGDVYLGVDVPALPFAPAHLSQAIATLTRFVELVENDLALPEPSPPEEPRLN